MRRSYDYVTDIMRIPVEGNANEAVQEVQIPNKLDELVCDVLVLGGGTGGTAATLAALEGGLTVIATEETDWLGGQFTSQGISAFDEHEHIESFGGTAAYSDLRDRIRRGMLEQLAVDTNSRDLNPGMCWVSNLAFDPRLAASVLDELMARFEKLGRLQILRRTKLVGATVKSGAVTEVVLLNLDNVASYQNVRPHIVIDATEFGDLLPLLGCEFRVGAESVHETGEPGAQPDSRRPDCSQGLTYAFACEKRPTGEVHTIPEPEKYKINRRFQPYTFDIDVHGGEVYSETSGQMRYRLYEQMPGTKGGVWTYRRLISASLDGAPHVGDVTMFNWPSNDYADPLLLLGSAHQFADCLQKAKRLSLGFLHWLQTEAPTEGEGVGAPELLLRPDVMGTLDGLAKHPYVRESRRIVAHRTIVEQDVSVANNDGPRAVKCPDAVGIGWYPIDIHPSGPHEIASSTRTRPFQIPLGALLPVGITNVIAGSKNIGSTHITNGCFRLHPVEWNIGEAAGLLAAFCLSHDLPILEVHGNDETRSAFQIYLLSHGVPLYWEIDHPPGHPHFIASQVLCLAGALDATSDLNFKPEQSVTAELWARVGGRGELPTNLAAAVFLLASNPPWAHIPTTGTLGEKSYG